jgi:hypothetical protein
MAKSTSKIQKRSPPRTGRRAKKAKTGGKKRPKKSNRTTKMVDPLPGEDPFGDL